jgi:MFS family permease
VAGFRSWWLVAVICGPTALDSLTVGMSGDLGPAVRLEFAVGPALLQWWTSAYVLAFGGLLLVGGRVTDAAGARRTLMGGLLLFAAGAVATAFAPTFGTVLGARALMGAGSALAGPSALSAMVSAFSEGRARHRMAGMYGLIGAAGFTTGLLIGGALGQAIGWRGAILFEVPLCAFLGVCAHKALPPDDRGSCGEIDLVAGLSITLGLVLLVLALTECDADRPNGLQILAIMAGSTSCLVFFGFRNNHRKTPMVPLEIIRQPTIALASVTAVLFFGAVRTILLVIPLYLVGHRGYSLAETGLAFVPMGIGVMISSSLARRYLAVAGIRLALALGQVVLISGLSFWLVAPAQGSYVASVLPATALMGMGQGIVLPAMTAAALTGVPKDLGGMAGAINLTFQQIGSGVGVAILIAVVELTSENHGVPSPGVGLSYVHDATAGAMVMSISCLICALVMPKSRKR